MTSFFESSWVAAFIVPFVLVGTACERSVPQQSAQASAVPSAPSAPRIPDTASIAVYNRAIKLLGSDSLKVALIRPALARLDSAAGSSDSAVAYRAAYNQGVGPSRQHGKGRADAV